MKNTINVSNKANLILNTYRCFFFKLLLRVFNVVQQLRSTAWKWKGSIICSAALERSHSKFVNQNGAKMVDLKLTEARTKIEARK